MRSSHVCNRHVHPAPTRTGRLESGIVTVDHSSIHVRNINNGFRRERKGSITLPRGNSPSSTLNVHTALWTTVKKKGKRNRGKSTSFSQTNKRKKKRKEDEWVKKLSGTRCTKREPKEKKQKQKHRPSQPGMQFSSQMPSPASLYTRRTPSPSTRHCPRCEIQQSGRLSQGSVEKERP